MSPRRLEGTVALVTGASSGIGAAAARRLAEAGARVFLSGRDPDRLAAAAAACGGTPVPCDLTDPDRTVALAGQVLDLAGRVDILVNNAGRGWAGPITAMTDAQIQSLVTANLTAPMLLSRALLPGMLSRGGGRLGFVGSIAGRLGVREEAVYAGTKAGLSVFADSLRKETAGRGIVVTELIPAVVDTPFFVHRGRPYPRSRPRPVTPDRAAAALVGGMLSGRHEVCLPRWMYLPIVVRATLPATYRRLADRFG